MPGSSVQICSASQSRGLNLIMPLGTVQLALPLGAILNNLGLTDTTAYLACPGVFDFSSHAVG